MVKTLKEGKMYSFQIMYNEMYFFVNQEMATEEH